MEYPQLSELEGRLGRLDGAPGMDHLVVHDPESSKQVDFLFKAPGRLFMRLILHQPRDAQLRAASELGLPTPEVRQYTSRYGEDRGKVIQQLWYWIPVQRNSEAAMLCLEIMFKVHGVEPKKWLWITNISEPDQWPDPLPRPNKWPLTS